MLETLKMKLWQKNQFIPDIRNAQMREQFRGLPKLDNSKCDSCGLCVNSCPTGAISLNPLTIDLAKCTLCGACKLACKNEAINFTNYYKLGVDKLEKLIITQEVTPEKFYENAIEIRKEIYSIFNRSIKFRQVSAGGCNGCEMELNASSNDKADSFVVSPTRVIVTSVKP